MVEEAAAIPVGGTAGVSPVILAPKRYANIDGEATACLLIGTTKCPEGKAMILGLPYLEVEHTGMWNPVVVQDTL